MGTASGTFCNDAEVKPTSHSCPVLTGLEVRRTSTSSAMVRLDNVKGTTTGWHMLPLRWT